MNATATVRDRSYAEGLASAGSHTGLFWGSRDIKWMNFFSRTCRNLGNRLSPRQAENDSACLGENRVPRFLLVLEKKSTIHISYQIFPDHPLYHIIDNIYIQAYCRGGGAFWCSKSGSLGRLDCHRSMLATCSTIKTVRVPTIWDLNNINSQFWYQVPYPITTGIYTFTTKRDRINFFLVAAVVIAPRAHIKYEI